ncbi:PASTA domain-containing protein [Paenibacillus sp. 5J-6]|uniref:PASTA domain-containing protein n=1 Tax=Paenibacillus silvestris TaxID=2606219 RepID=A0A6L8VB39_9BACL|nr:PASTA domain-containing protein [Paenibacillus silvestris]MZQ86882.1 PASTA domain-containing protein [Paenibacillus silvestris]
MGNLVDRYMIVKPLKQMSNGLIVRGQEVSSKRDVLLYTSQESDETANHEVLRWMEEASQMTNKHVMQIVDFGTEDGTLYAALQVESGKPLSDRLNDLEITGHKALTYVHELALAIRKTRSNQLLDYAVDAENLWIEANGQLRILNSWTQGKNGRRGVPGLALLLYQLGAKTDIPTSSMSAYSYEMSLLFADLAEVTKQRAVALACKAYEGLSTLEEFQLELGDLLGLDGNRSKPLSYSHAESSITKKKKTVRKWTVMASTSFGVLVLLLLIALRPHSDYADDANRQPIPTSGTAANSPNATVTPQSSATPSPTPTGKPVVAETLPTGDDAEQAEKGIVPNLVGHTREDAEKMALASGLRYQFLLEPSTADKGIVFKQDMVPGTTVNDGDRITFWVSKGP